MGLTLKEKRKKAKIRRARAFLNEYYDKTSHHIFYLTVKKKVPGMIRQGVERGEFWTFPGCTSIYRTEEAARRDGGGDAVRCFSSFLEAGKYAILEGESLNDARKRALKKEHIADFRRGRGIVPDSILNAIDDREARRTEKIKQEKERFLKGGCFYTYPGAKSLFSAEWIARKDGGKKIKCFDNVEEAINYATGDN